MQIYKIVLPVLAGIFLLSCDQNPKNEVEVLTEKRDSIKKELDKLNKKYLSISEKLKALDTTQKLTKVTTLTVQPQPFKHFFRVQASVESDQNIVVYPETQGLIERILVKEGDKVAAGQLLMTLDSRVIRKNIAELENSLELANTVYERQERLWEQKIGSEIQFLEAKNNKTSLERRIETLKAQLSSTQIKAPFDGTIDQILPKVGEMASPAMPVARLINMSELYLTAEVSERYIGRVFNGSPAKVSLPSMGLETTGKIVQVGNFIEKANRSFNIRIKLDDKPEKDTFLKPNLIAVVDILDFETDSALVVPSQVILQSSIGENYLYLVSGEPNSASVSRVTVETGLSYQGNTHVKLGLKPNDEVVEKGGRSITEGQLVQVVKQ
jgi:membrane fusion protein (multidrug efflux system)